MAMVSLWMSAEMSVLLSGLFDKCHFKSISGRVCCFFVFFLELLFLFCSDSWQTSKKIC